MRLLLVSHVPLLAELGAAQVTLNLAEALRRRGHTVEAWSPGPLDGARWWELWRCQRRAIEEHLERAGPFDVVDLPAVSISRRIAASARTVARSLQPDLRYRWSTLRSEALRWPPSPRFPFHVAYDLTFAGATIGGAADNTGAGRSSFRRTRSRLLPSSSSTSTAPEATITSITC